MCGRYILTSTGDVIAEAFDLDDEPDVEARYNIAPGQDAPVVRATAPGRQCRSLRWGFTAGRSGQRTLINARSETVAERPTFRRSFAEQRCVVPSNGFFEWRRAAGQKTPYLLGLVDGGLYGMAGLWTVEVDTDRRRRLSFVILTTSANELVARIHDRMPAILDRSGCAAWLDPEQSIDTLRTLLRPLPEQRMRSFPVSDYVNSAFHEGERCIERADEPAEQQLLF